MRALWGVSIVAESEGAVLIKPSLLLLLSSKSQRGLVAFGCAIFLMHRGTAWFHLSVMGWHRVRLYKQMAGVATMNYNRMVMCTKRRYFHPTMILHTFLCRAFTVLRVFSNDGFSAHTRDLLAMSICNRTLKNLLSDSTAAHHVVVDWYFSDYLNRLSIRTP